MTKEDTDFLNRINKYAEDILKDIDPQKTHVSEQLSKLRPIMEQIASETGEPIENIFIRYMDLASEQKAKEEADYKRNLGENYDFTM